MQYPIDMDPQCINLCDSLNNLIGIETCESCCGHGKNQYKIWFTVIFLNDIKPILRAIENTIWKINVSWNNITERPIFLLYAPPTATAFSSNKLADKIKEEQDQ
jgi:hypothetical protein